MKKLFALLLTVLMLMSLTAVAVVATEGTEGEEETPAPIIFRFNNEDMLADWDSSGWSASPDDFEIRDGVGYIEGFSQDAPAIAAYTYNAGENVLNLDDYPFVKVKYKWETAHTGGQIQYYMYNANGDNNLKSLSATKNTWVVQSIDYSTSATYGGYASAKKSIDFWFRGNKQGITGSSQIEYIALFATKAEMDAFDSVNPTVQGSSDAYLPYYTQVNNILTAVQTAVDGAQNIETVDAAKTLVQNAYNTALAANTAEGMVLDTKFTAYRNIENTKFTVKVSVTETSSPVEARLVLNRTFEIAKAGAAEEGVKPVIYRFNNAEMLGDWYKNQNKANPAVIKDGVAFTDKFPSENASVHDNGIDDHRLDFAEGELDLRKYPYFKLKYKWSSDGETGAPTIQVYFNMYPSGNPHKQTNLTGANDGLWGTVTYDISGDAYQAALKRIDVWFRYGKTNSNTEIEYVAFFPDKASADAFDAANPTVQGSSDAYLPYKTVADELLAAVKAEVAKNTAVVKSADEAKAAFKAVVDKVIADTQIDPAQISYTVGEAKEVTGGYAAQIELGAGPKETRSFVSSEIAVSDNIPAPVIWRFNNQEMIALWSNKTYNRNSSELIDGVMHTVYDTGKVVDDHFYRTNGQSGEMPEEYQFSLTDFPYIKVKYKHSGSASAIRLHLWNSTSSGDPYVGFTPGATDTWQTKSFNLATTTITGGTATGTLKRFSMWFWNGQKEGSSDIEYIAFFHKDDKAAWEAFDTVEGVASTTAGTSDKFLPYYNEINAIADAGAAAVAADDNKYPTYDKAARAIEAMFKAEAAKLGNINANDVTVTAEVLTKAETEATYKVTVYTGPVEARVIATETVKANIKSSFVWHLGNPDFIKKLSRTADVALSIDGENGSTFMHAQAKTERDGVAIDKGGLGYDNFNLSYSDIDKDHGIELSDYPVVAIRYRASKSGSHQLYYGTDVTGNTGASGSFYRSASHSGGAEWKTLYLDSNTQVAGAWAGKLKFIRLDFLRYSYTEDDYVDFDYIGFFATMEDAQAYTKKVEGDIAKTASAAALVKDDLNGSYTDVSDKTDAENKINDILSVIPEDVQTKVELIGYETTDPTVKDDYLGSYKFRVFFVNGPVYSAAVSYVDGNFKLMPDVQLTALGAQIRAGVENGAPQGLRFGTTINKSMWKDVDVTDISYGTVVIPARMLDGELTLETEGAKDVPAVNKFKETDTEVTFTAVVTNIPDKEYNTQIAARAYAKYTFAGDDYVVYADSTKIRSVNDVIDLSGDGYEEYPQLLGNVTYDRATWMTPFWEGNTVYHELFWPVMPEGADEGDDLVVDLLYPVSDVIVVKNGTHTQDYYEGKDYYVNADGQLVIPAGSDIYRTPFDEYISDTQKTVVGAISGNRWDYKAISSTLPEHSQYAGKYIYYSEGAEIQATYQYSISYRHTAEWDENAPLPAYEENALPRTRAKLANKQAINIGYYGDSITDCGNQTGSFGVSPNTIHWREAVAKTLENMYGYTEGGNRINVRSKAVGGTGSGWGRNGGGSYDSIPNGFAAYRFAADASQPYNNGIPDLFVLAFGMNDEGLTPETFKDNISNIVDQILTLNSQCEFVLVSTSMSNSLLGKRTNREQFESVLEELVTEKRAKGVNIDVANVSSMHKYFLTIKPYRDMTGNNVNHQNDMLSRLYAQTIVTTIAGECK
ncbi:MAG: SGNH/GDSL hydrolase family protein [Ruminococcaceae bacterium]|nr:SGNH/GDSL hydrolase family protein [Oscillospiraceae bacterium]